MKHILLLVIFSLFLTGSSLAMDDQPLFAMDEDQPLVVMLGSSKPYPDKLPFSGGCKREVIPLTPQKLIFASEKLQLKELDTFMQFTSPSKNKILYATNKEALFALYFIVIAKNPIRFDAVVLQNSALPNDVPSIETFFRDVPTLKKCEKISNDIPIIFASEGDNDKMIHAALRLAGKNAHILPRGAVCDNIVETYSRKNPMNNVDKQLNESAVKAALDRKEKERMHRYKEYGWWVGSALLVLFLSYKSGLLEKIVGKLSFNK